MNTTTAAAETADNVNGLTDTERAALDDFFADRKARIAAELARSAELLAESRARIAARAAAARA